MSKDPNLDLNDPTKSVWRYHIPRESSMKNLLEWKYFDFTERKPTVRSCELETVQGVSGSES